MTRGQAQRLMRDAHVHGIDRLAVEVIEEAELAVAEAESAAIVDAKRREFDRAVEDHCMRFGFDPHTGHLL